MVSGVFCISLDAALVVSNKSDSTDPSGLAIGQYVGSVENQLVQTAVDLLQNRERRYSPVVLFGPTGTGKSLLARGLAGQWRRQHPQDAVVVVAGSDFARAFANAVASNGLGPFRKKLRTADLLVVEDIHQMQRKSGAQEEFVQTLDSLQQREAMVLVTANVAPADSPAVLCARVRSRLAQGLCVPLAAPGRSAQQWLIRRLSDLHELELSEEAYDCLAEGLRDSRLTVPELNHIIVQLRHACRAAGQSPDAAAVRAHLDEQLGSQRPTVGLIAQRVSQHFSIRVQELRGPARKQHIVRARQVAMHLARELTGNSLEAIGRFFGNRDHTTVLHACRRAQALQETDAAVAQAVHQLTQQLARH